MPQASISRSASSPASLPSAATAPNAPAVAGRKKRSAALDATPSPAPMSIASASAVMRSRPDTPPARSAQASAAASGTVMACTTAGSWTQSNSWLCAWKPLTSAALGAGRVTRWPQACASLPLPQRCAWARSSDANGARLPATPTPRLSSTKVFAAAIAVAGRSSKRVATTCAASRSAASGSVKTRPGAGTRRCRRRNSRRL